MKLRTKMVFAFLAVVLAPILLFGGSLFVMMHFQFRTIQEVYGINNASDILSSNMLEIFTEVTSEVRAEMEADQRTDPELLTEESQWDAWNQRLSGQGAYLIVESEGHIRYDGHADAEKTLEDAGIPSDTVQVSEGVTEDREDFYQLLPSGDEISGDSNQYYYMGMPWQCLVSCVCYGDSTGSGSGLDNSGDNAGIEVSSGSSGVIYLVTSVRDIFPSFWTILFDIGIMVLLVLVFTALLLTMWLYNSILKPLATLQRATRAIRDGNLDFSLEVTGNDEISELCKDFEDMRVRLKATAEEKIQYDRENKVLISNISHDLKTPLTAVKGYCEGILDGVASTPEKVNKYIRTIYNKANDMQRLLDELTLYSKIDTNRIPYNFTKINVKAYFQDCAEEISMDLDAQNIEMTYSNYLDDDVMIIGDTEQLKRVVNNIISNSVKYMDKKKGFLSLRLRDDGDFVHVEIEDNGKGIATKDLPFIFDRFYRTDSSRNSSTGGSGIGLSIVKKIIEDHGGRIWATSKEGTGTIMHFVLRKYTEVINE